MNANTLAKTPTLFNKTTKLNRADYEHLKIYTDEKHQLQWCYILPQSRPCFTLPLMQEFKHFYSETEHQAKLGNMNHIKYQVIASMTPSAFSLGGDLDLFRQCVRSKDFDTIHKFATTCIEAMFTRATMSQHKITQISLVQGDALGGGFEGALAADVVIAESQSKFGFPDILFNSFPGVGAFTFLTRRIGLALTEKLILSGKTYSATELYEMGVIDVLAEPGEGELALYRYINRENRSKNTFNAIRKIRNQRDPIHFQELADVVNIWVDSAKQLTQRDLRMIDRLVTKQLTFNKTDHAA